MVKKFTNEDFFLTHCKYISAIHVKESLQILLVRKSSLVKNYTHVCKFILQMH